MLSAILNYFLIYPLTINHFHLNKEVTGMFQKFDKVVGFLYGAFIVAFAIAVIKGI